MTFSQLLICFNIFWSVIVPSFKVVSGSTYTDAANVYKELTANYTKEMRPILDQSESVEVSVIPILRSISSYNEVTGALSIILVMTLEWKDEKLTWDPLQYGGYLTLVIPQKNIWKPELFLINPAGTIAPIGNDAFKIRVLFDGSAVWFTGGEIKTSCSPDLTYFPFDIQTCSLTFAPWGYTASEVSLYASQSVDVSNVSANGAWTLKEIKYKVYEMTIMSVVEITLKLERKSLYYILTLVFPILSLCFLNPMVFTLPYGSGERVSFCITILLSFAVFLTLTGEIIPKVSKPMPLLCIYLFTVQMFSGMITTSNGLILRAYNHEDDDPVPPLLWKIILISIKVFGCSCCNCKSSIHPKKTQTGSEDKGSFPLEDYQESDSKKEEKASKHLEQKTSWQTVATTMDRVGFILSYLLFTIVSLFFLVHTATLGEI